MNYESDREIRRQVIGREEEEEREREQQQQPPPPPKTSRDDLARLGERGSPEPMSAAGPGFGEGESHATTTGAAAAGAITGGVIGLSSGAVGAAIGAVGGAIVGAAAERMMHTEGEEDQEADLVRRDQAEHMPTRGAPDQRRVEYTTEARGAAQPTTTRAEPLGETDSPREAYVDRVPVDRQPADRPPTEVEEPVGEPLAEVEEPVGKTHERKPPRPLI